MQRKNKPTIVILKIIKCENNTNNNSNNHSKVFNNRKNDNKNNRSVNKINNNNNSYNSDFKDGQNERLEKKITLTRIRNFSVKYARKYILIEGYKHDLKNNLKCSKEKNNSGIYYTYHGPLPQESANVRY